MSLRHVLSLSTVIVVTSVAFVGLEAQGQTKRLSATLVGTNEVPTLVSTGHGAFVAQVASDDSEFTYDLSFDNLEGNVTQSHIHLGALSTNGGIMIWLCGTATNPGPAGTPACPSPGGSVQGTVSAANVVGPAGQGVAAGEWERALHALRSGVSYVNVHSNKYPGGEIRGQVNLPGR
jgi:hypothetical protein